MRKIIFYLIILQIFISLFSVGMNIVSPSGVTSFSWYILICSLLTWIVWFRLQTIPPEGRGFNLVLEHGCILSLVSWFFHVPWGKDWEVILMIVMTIVGVGIVILALIKSQYHRLVGINLFAVAPFWWQVGAIASLIAINTGILYLIILHGNFAPLYPLLAWVWLFLWKS